MKHLKLIEQEHDYDCGVACIAMALQYFFPETPMSLKEIEYYLGTFRQTGTPPDSIIKGCKESLGMNATYVKMATWEDLTKVIEDSTKVAICDVWDKTDGHYVIPIGIHNNFVVLADPSYGYRLMDRITFYRNWFDWEDYSSDKLNMRTMIILERKNKNVKLQRHIESIV